MSYSGQSKTDLDARTPSENGPVQIGSLTDAGKKKKHLGGG